MNKTIPQSVEAEEGILAAILIDPSTIHDVIDIVSPSDMYSLTHRLIYSAILELYADKKPYDLVTVTGALRDSKNLERIGGASKIAQIIDECPAATNVRYYAKVIKQKSINRELITLGKEIVELALSGQDVLDEVQRKALEIQYNSDSSAIPIQKILMDAVDRYEQRQKNKGITGEPYGLVDLDYRTGGMQRGDLILIAGRPAMGKSALAQQIAVRTDKPSAIFSLEMSSEQMADRFIASGTGINSALLRNGHLGQKEWEKISSAADRMSRAGVFVIDDPSVTVQDISRQARSLIRNEGVGSIIVDYLQLMTSGGQKNRNLEIGAISRGLKLLARECDVPVVALSQLNRGVESRENKRPFLSDLRESGELEQNADVVIMLYRDEVYNEDTPDPNIIEMIIRKQRMGPTMTVKAVWDGPTTSINDLAR
jgi:replicative DNA helicase